METLDTHIIDKKPDWKFLDKVIENIKNIEKKDMMQCVREIYEATYYRYAMKWYEESVRTEKYKSVVIEKTRKIMELQEALRLAIHFQENKEAMDDTTLEQLKSTYEKHKE